MNESSVKNFTCFSLWICTENSYPRVYKNLINKNVLITRCVEQIQI